MGVNFKEFYETFEINLKENKFTVLNKKNVDGYFVFEKGENSVIHFDIKELKGWKFALWIDYYEETNLISRIQFLAQHKDWIDKFKPSASSIIETLEFEQDYEYFDKYDLDEFVGMVKMIKATPMISYLKHCGTLFSTNITTRTFQYLSEKYINKKNLVRNWYKETFKYNHTYLKLLWMKFVLTHSKTKDIVDSVKIIDSNNDSFVCSPRYALEVTQVVTKDVTYYCILIGYLFGRPNGERRHIKNANMEFYFDGTRNRYYYELEDGDIECAYPIRSKFWEIINKWKGK